MKNLNAILTPLLLASVVSSVFNYKNNQLLRKRIDVMSCRLDVATARIDLLNNMRVERPRCLDDLTPQRARKGVSPHDQA